MLHSFKKDISGIELPERFNNPFYYSPHKLAAIAADEVRDILAGCPAALADALDGKMFGVLVVQDGAGRIGFLAAFSGLLAGSNSVEGFVPPVFDFQSPAGYFKREEACITAINAEIEEIESSATYTLAKSEAEAERGAADAAVAALRAACAARRAARAARRSAAGLQPSDEAQMIKESQYDKAELKRTIRRWQLRVAEKEASLQQYRHRVEALAAERRTRSAALQQWLFEQFKMLNARGEQRTMLRIFALHNGALPPAGAGECAAPKLLQYAYLHSYRPLAMAEFWIGASPTGEIRRDGCFYASCKSKCEPILSFMLQGLDVEDNALEKGNRIESLDILYEDTHLLIVDKPAGVLSVPGIVGGMSVQQWLREECRHSNELFVAHRLDMATSGLLVVAKSMYVYKKLQAMFAAREVEKEYTALLDGVPAASHGKISLPLAADYDNRPRQRVDASGKEAITYYKVITEITIDGRRLALLLFRPVTGRTHQLRVHAAASAGLNCPIVGDALYGTAGSRLMLHASALAFRHPITGKEIRVESDARFL